MANGQPALALGPFFKLTFVTVTVLTLLSLGVVIVLAITGADNEASKNLLDTWYTPKRLRSPVWQQFA